MEYMGNKKFWDDKFKSRQDKILNPEQVIFNHINEFIGNSVLDIACGDGRNSMLFLRYGFNVTGLDFSKEGLKRLEVFAQEYKNHLKLIQLDLTNENCFINIGKFDNILISHYRLNSSQLKQLKNLVVPSGILLITGFNENHICNDRISKNELIYKSDINLLLEDFTIVSQEDMSDTRGSFITYIMKRKNP